MLGQLRRIALGISVDEASFAKRGFRAQSAQIRHRLESVGGSFIEGYLRALEAGRPVSIDAHLEGVASEFRGFAYEGAAMAFALLDGLIPWRRSRIAEFIEGPGQPHLYMAHVGAGWAFARLRHLRRHVTSYLARFDPLLGWLILDGYGFHEGYFHWRQYFLDQVTPSGLSVYARRVFDQGLGRSLWFVAGGDPCAAASLLSGFPSARQSDLWSGLGLACAYAGGTDRDSLVHLREKANGFLPHVRQGAAFAAKARQRADNPSPETDMACEILCGMSAGQAAAVTDEALTELPLTHDRCCASARGDGAAGLGSASIFVQIDGSEPAYERWRSRIRGRFSD